jgi:hypothetical protein
MSMGTGELVSRSGKIRYYDHLGLVHTFGFSTGRQVSIIAGQSSGTQESIGVVTRPGRLPGREFVGRLPGSAWCSPLLCPVAGR